MVPVRTRSDANLFMIQFDKESIKYMPLLYLRYIDNTFVIWKRTKEQFITFVNELSVKQKSIKLEYEIFSFIIRFLHKMIHKGRESNLQTTLYRKSTDQQSSLHAKSDNSSSLGH